MSKTSPRKPTIHIIAQSKGGVAKSMVAWLLAQVLPSAGIPTRNFDADQMNPTFSKDLALNARVLDLMEGDTTINSRLLDGWLEELASDVSTDVVVDVGANSFLPVMKYMISGGSFELLQECGYRIVLHTVVVGGGNMADTFNCGHFLMGHVPASIGMVIWANEYYGPIVHNGIGIEGSSLVLDNAKRIISVIRMPRYDAELQDNDIQTLRKEHITFAEAVAPGAAYVSFAARHRLKGVWDFYAQQVVKAVA
jgi:hypothetical protein